MRTLFRHDPRTLLLILGSTLLIPLAAFAAIACTDDSGPAVGGTVTIAVAGVPPLIQEPRRDISATGGIGKDFSIYETIVRAPHVSPPTPPPQDHTGYSPSDLGLAESWEIASDFNSITFKIRADIPWHDNGGDWGELTAEDVAFTYNSAFAADSVNNGAEEIGPEMKAGFDVIDDLTVRQNIVPGGFDPTWAWLQGNAGFNGIVIVSKKAFDELGTEGFGTTPVGTGRYKATEWVADDQVKLEAVRDHWTGDQPSIGSVNIVHMPEPASREAALRAGEIDIGELSPQIINQVANAIGGTVQEIGIARPQGFQMAGNYWSTQCADCEGGQMPRPGWEEGLDKGYPWIGDPSDATSMENARKVRWAMAMAVDRDSIITNVLDGLGRVIYAWQNILPDDPMHKDEWNIPHDVAMAKQYMAEAGYADGFEMEIWVPSTFSPGTIAAAEAVAEMWRSQLGIDVTIDRTEYGARRPQTVDKTINVPFTHGINWIPGATSARYICAAAGHIVGFTMEQSVCDTGLSNATEQSLNQRIANNIEVQDYLSHQMLFLPMFQHSANLFAVAPTIASWDPYNSQDVLPNRPESMVLADSE
ncbi:MAG: ABC transporter substrate-binding protein [Chloroflexi bacterium]|nr:ABC transporter substrate-binding protein [Chloroflexota bacterium]